MSIVKNEKNDGSIVYLYKEPDKKTSFENAEKLMKCLKILVGAFSDLDISDISCDFRLIGEIIVRVDKRKDYFQIFHDDTDMNEIKQAALIGYWFVKFKPLSIKSNSEVHKSKYSGINEQFAAFIIFSTLCEVAYRSERKGFKITTRYKNRLLYALKYWDLSKESIILVCESICEAIEGL